MMSQPRDHNYVITTATSHEHLTTSAHSNSNHGVRITADHVMPDMTSSSWTGSDVMETSRSGQTSNSDTSEPVTVVVAVVCVCVIILTVALLVVAAILVRCVAIYLFILFNTNIVQEYTKWNKENGKMKKINDYAYTNVEWKWNNQLITGTKRRQKSTVMFGK